MKKELKYLLIATIVAVGILVAFNLMIMLVIYSITAVINLITSLCFLF